MKKLIIGLVLGVLIGSASVTLAAEGDEVTAIFAKFNLVINGQAKDLDEVPLVYNGTSYLPVRNLANLVGYDVTYKADNRTIELNVTSATYGPDPNNGGVPVIEEKPSVIEPGSQVINENALMGGRALVELLAQKYPEQAKKIRLTQEGILSFDGKQYQLLLSGSPMKCDITPLLEANILTMGDIGN